MNDRTLFDVDRTTHQACAVPGCAGVRLAGENKADDCLSDRENSWAPAKRLRGCLNAHDPAHAPFPEGF